MNKREVVKEIARFLGPIYIPKICKVLEISRREIKEKINWEIRLKEADTFEKCFCVYKEASITKIKFRALIKSFKFATTIEDFNKLNQGAPDNSKIEIESFKKLHNLLEQKLNEAKTFDEIMDVYYDSSKNNPVHIKALKKGSVFAKTYEDFKELCEAASSKNKKIELEAGKKALDLAKNYYDIFRLFEKIPDKYSKFKLIAFNKTIESATTFEEFWHIYGLIDNFNDFYKVHKLKSKAFKKCFQSAHTYKECSEVYNSAQDKKTRSKILVKWAGLSKTTSEYAHVFHARETSPKIKKFCIKKMSEIIMNEK